MEAKLIVLDGKQKGREIPLPETIFLIGRDPQCHLRPHCSSVSKLHCAVAAWAGLVRVRDLKSRNGTFVNGQQIHGEVPVTDGDHLQIGTLAFSFSIKKKDGTPITAPIKVQEVEWLLESTDESGVLANSEQTCTLPALIDEPDPAAGLAPSAAAGTSTLPRRNRKSKVVSAGKHFRDYFEMRKSPPAAG